MTANPPTPHLDDEAISAVLDGEGTAEEAAHVEACATCRARLGALREAAALVATPVPSVDDARRDAVIAAALDAPATAPSASVVPLRRRVPTQWLSAAAAVLVVVAAFAFLGRAGGDDDDDSASAGDTSELAAGDSAADDAGADSFTALAAPAPYDAGDVGAVELGGLRDQIEGALGTALGTAQRDADAVAGSSSGGGATAPNPAASSESQANADAAAPPCEAEIRAEDATLAALVYRATGTLDDEPVVVLAFGVGEDRRTAYVLSVDGCTIRSSQTYSI